MFAGMTRYSLTGALIGVSVVLSACGGAGAAAPAAPAPTATVTVTAEPVSAPSRAATAAPARETHTPTPPANDEPGWYRALATELRGDETAADIERMICRTWDGLTPSTEAVILQDAYEHALLVARVRQGPHAVLDRRDMAERLIMGACPQHLDTFLAIDAQQPR